MTISEEVLVDVNFHLTFTNRWLYTRNLVYDGNFSADHLKPKRPLDDVFLSHGYGFMVSNDRYQRHLQMAKEIKEVRFITFFLFNDLIMAKKIERKTCHDYSTIHRANMLREHLLSTGLGASACTRHGCWVPHSVVDFQKGER